MFCLLLQICNMYCDRVVLYCVLRVVSVLCCVACVYCVVDALIFVVQFFCDAGLTIGSCMVEVCKI